MLHRRLRPPHPAAPVKCKPTYRRGAATGWAHGAPYLQDIVARHKVAQGNFTAGS